MIRKVIGLMCCALASLALFGCLDSTERVFIGEIKEKNVFYEFNFNKNSSRDFWELEFVTADNHQSSRAEMVEVQLTNLRHNVLFATSQTAQQEDLPMGVRRVVFTGPISEIVNGKRSISVQKFSEETFGVSIAIKVSGEVGERLPIEVYMVSTPLVP